MRPLDVFSGYVRRSRARVVWIHRSETRRRESIRGRGPSGCGKSNLLCHSERSEESLSGFIAGWRFLGAQRAWKDKNLSFSETSFATKHARKMKWVGSVFRQMRSGIGLFRAAKIWRKPRRLPPMIYYVAAVKIPCFIVSERCWNPLCRWKCSGSSRFDR